MDNWSYQQNKNKKRKRTRRKRARMSSYDEDTDTEVDANPETSIKKPWLSGCDSAKNVSRESNHIYFYAGVTKQSVYKMNDYLLQLNSEFKELQSQNPTVKMQPDPIYLHINSYGGSVFAGFAAIDFIQQSEIPVHTVVEGATASAGTLMSVVGKKRYIRPHASMLIHQLSSWLGGKMTEIEVSFKNLEQMMDTIKTVYIKHTKLGGQKLDDFLKHDLWWKTDKCLEQGLVDEIWEPNKN